MRVLEASKTCQQISNGSDVLEFVMNELTHELGTVTLWGLGGHVEEVVPVQKRMLRQNIACVSVEIRQSQLVARYAAFS